MGARKSLKYTVLGWEGTSANPISHLIDEETEPEEMHFAHSEVMNKHKNRNTVLASWLPAFQLPQTSFYLFFNL